MSDSLSYEIGHHYVPYIRFENDEEDVYVYLDDAKNIRITDFESVCSIQLEDHRPTLLVFEKFEI